MKTIKPDLGVGGAHLEYDLKGILQELQALFDASGGHDHSTTDKGKPVPSAGLADGNLFALTYFIADLPANLGSVFLSIGQSTNLETVMPRAGSIIGIAVASNAPRTGGTATFDVYRNGSAQGMTVAINATNPQYAYATAAKGAKPFAAGDRITVKASTDSAWAPTTADLVAVVYCQV